MDSRCSSSLTRCPFPEPVIGKPLCMLWAEQVGWAVSITVNYMRFRRLFSALVVGVGEYVNWIWLPKFPVPCDGGS
jgi:hypothetical protein